MNDEYIEVNRAKVEKKNGLSAVWIIPLVALVFGGYLMIKAYMERGFDIVLKLQSADGIVAGKTEVKYRGLTAGIVKDIQLDEGLQSVSVLIEMDAQTKASLGKNAAFWLVKPEVTVSGITGLETITSGNYIAFRPDAHHTASPLSNYEALLKAPPLSIDTPGLHLTIKAKNKGSIRVGTQLFYKKIAVGEVTTFSFDNAKDTVSFNVHIQSEYQHLITDKTRFWSMGGITVKGGLQRFEVQTGSLVSLIGGGIAFDQFGDETVPSKPVSNGAEFKLHDDFDDARYSKMISIEFPAVEGIEAGVTPIVYKGVSVGEVKSVEIDSKLKTISASVGINPRFDWTLKESTQFWLVAPSIEQGSFKGLLSGTYITLIPGEGEARSNFQAHINAPVFNSSAPGLQFVIQAERAGSIRHGSAIYYQNMPVGTVQGVRLNKKRGGVDIFVHVDNQHADLVKRQSRFYQASGVAIKGDLGGFKVQTESLASVLQGGLAFYNPKGVVSKPAKDGATFKLYEDYEHAITQGVAIKVLFDQANGLRVGMPIKFQDQKVGEVISINYENDLRKVVVSAELNRKAVKYARKDSRFWLVQPEVGLTNVKNLETIVTGTYLGVSPGKGAATYEFIGIDRPPVIRAHHKGLNLVLASKTLGSIEVGDPVTYRQIEVGEVIGVDLASDANGVLVYINIFSKYRPLIKSDTVFWNGSGISVEAGLFTGLKIDTESMESILAGGIEFATPPHSQNQKDATQGMEFKLYDDAKSKWVEWLPNIKLD